MNQVEEWRGLPEWPEIEVSNKGRVRRIEYIDKRGKARRPKVLTPQRRFGGTQRAQSGFVRVTRGENIHDLCVSDLVCAAFFSDFDPDFHQASFVDRDPANCAVRNIILIPRFAAKLAKKLGGEPTTTRQGELA